MRMIEWSALNDPEDWTATGGLFECRSPWDYIWPNLPYFGWGCLAPTEKCLLPNANSRPPAEAGGRG